MIHRGHLPLEIERWLDDLDARARLSAWCDEPEEMALRLNVVHFQEKAGLFRASGDRDKALYYEELVAERLELLDEMAVAFAATGGRQ